MSKHRLLISKDGKAKYISHLDFMHTMQRAFLRANVKVRHTEGFNPHPYMSFALPLSVGTGSVCELMDFDLADENMSLDRLPETLNRVMPEGIRVLEAYEAVRKFKEISWLEVEGSLEYDRGNAYEAKDKAESLFEADSIVIKKKSKKGITDFDIVPCIKALSLKAESENKITMNAVITAQNPSLNPEYLIAALREQAPEACPDFAEFTRLNVYDSSMEPFR